MAGITLEEAQAQLDVWLEASKKTAVSGQSYSIAGRILTRANTKEIGKEIDRWNKIVNTLSRGGPQARGGIPL